MTTSFAVLGTLAILLITQLVKKFIFPKFGATGVHVFVAILALIATGVQVAITHYPGFATFITEAGTFLVAAVGVYEVILKKILPSDQE